MIGITNILNTERHAFRGGMPIIRSIVQALASPVRFAVHAIRRAGAVHASSIRSLQQASATTNHAHHDRLRQALNLLLAVAQLLAIGWSATAGFSEASGTRSVAEPPVVPALYTFSVWFVIYAGALIYAVYQALPSQRDSALLRRVGWWTAGAFFATTLWALAAGFGVTWLTVPIMFVMFAMLLGAYINFSREHAAQTTAECLFVQLPLSIFLGYITVATVANTASVLTQRGVTSLFGLPSTVWSVGMLLVAGLIASFLVQWSRGNLGYALTIIWALVGIVVANVSDTPNAAVAVTASGMAILVAGVLLRARWNRSGPQRAR